jgi:phosphatidylglycerophosphate synthase
LIKDKFGRDFDRWVKAGVPFLFKREINPNLLTVVGTVVCVGAAWAYGRGEFLTGALLLWGGGLFDLVDGVVARHFQRSSAFGAFLDSTLDRLVDMAVLIAIVIHFASIGDPITACVAAIALVASILTSYTKARAEALDIDLPGGIIERGERVILLVAGGVFGVMQPMLWVLAVGATATVVQRFSAARRGIGRMDSERAARAASGTGDGLAHGTSGES